MQWGLHAVTHPYRVPAVSFPWLKDENGDVSSEGLTAVCKLNGVG